jgi:hypothetical protein
MAEAESNGGGDEKTREKPGTLRQVIITAAFTLLGGIIGVLGKGYYDLAIEKQKSTGELALEDKKVTAELNLEKEKFEENKHLERQKLDADLVKLALQASSGTGAETLGFMVQTNLIEDSDIRKGVIAYLDSKKPVPRLQTETNTWFNQSVIEPVTSPNGKLRANVPTGTSIVLADISTIPVQFYGAFPTGGEFIKAMCFSPDSRKLLAAASNSVFVWDVTTGQAVSKIRLPWPPDSVKFSDDGKKIEVRNGKEQVVYDENGNNVDSK